MLAFYVNLKYVWQYSGRDTDTILEDLMDAVLPMLDGSLLMSIYTPRVCDRKSDHYCIK